MARPLARSLVAAIAGLALVGAGAAPALAGSAGASTAGTADGNDLRVHDVTIRLADAHVTGPGLPDRSIDRARYVVDDAHASVGGLDVEVGTVGVVLEDVSIGES